MSRVPSSLGLLGESSTTQCPPSSFQGLLPQDPPTRMSLGHCTPSPHRVETGSGLRKEWGQGGGGRGEWATCSVVWTEPGIPRQRTVGSTVGEAGGRLRLRHISPPPRLVGQSGEAVGRGAETAGRLTGIGERGGDPLTPWQSQVPSLSSTVVAMATRGNQRPTGV